MKTNFLKKDDCYNHFSYICTHKSSIRTMANDSSVLLIFTGGTISMGENPATQSLSPLNTEQVLNFIPELKMLHVNISSVSFNPLIDSSDIQIDSWVRIAELIRDNYEHYDGFVVLHGTDTMAYSASALSFMLENLSKPVIFTGSQLPVGVLRSDAKENLITAIELAAAKNRDNEAIVPEVCLFFEDKLMRGNRTTKRNTEAFNAFASFNYPELAKTGVHIKYASTYIHSENGKSPFRIQTQLDPNLAILKLFPGVTEAAVKAIFSIEGLRAVVLESFGAGNAPRVEWLFQHLKNATKKGIVIVNVTQCRSGSVEMGRYETSINLQKAGIVSGYDMTLEAAVTKLMYLLGQNENSEDIRQQMTMPLRGEITID